MKNNTSKKTRMNIETEIEKKIKRMPGCFCTFEPDNNNDKKKNQSKIKDNK